jgi:ribosome recycling factor
MQEVEALRVDPNRTGRAHIGLLDHVQVDYYGSMVPVNTVANITVIDPRTGRAGRKGTAAKTEGDRDCDLG